MKRLVAIVVILLALPLAAQPQRPKVPMRNGKPVYEREFMIVTPGDFEAFYRTADDIAEVTISSSRVQLVNEWPRTFYTATISRVFKGTGSKGKSVEFSQNTGEFELPDRIRRSVGQPPLQTGSTFIVFLSRNEALGGRVLVGERDGAFKLEGGRIIPQGFTHVADEHRNLAERAFIDELERVDRRVKPRV